MLHHVHTLWLRFDLYVIIAISCYNSVHWGILRLKILGERKGKWMSKGTYYPLSNRSRRHVLSYMGYERVAMAMRMHTHNPCYTLLHFRWLCACTYVRLWLCEWWLASPGG